MSTESANVHPWFTKTLKEICHDYEISLRSLSLDWLWELEKNGVTRRVLGTGFELNSAIASSICRDKVATFELLNTYGIPVVPHYIFRPKDGSILGGELDWAEGVVMKPINGQMSRGVMLVSSKQQAIRAASGRDYRWAVSPFKAISSQIRVILLDGEVILCFAKGSAIVNGLKIFYTSKSLEYTLTPDEEALAREAQSTIGLRLCAVDLIKIESGETQVLEVNTSITLQPYALRSEQHAVRAKEAYEKIIDRVFTSE